MASQATRKQFEALEATHIRLGDDLEALKKMHAAQIKVRTEPCSQLLAICSFAAYARFVHGAVAAVASGLGFAFVGAYAQAGLAMLECREESQAAARREDAEMVGEEEEGQAQGEDEATTTLEARFMLGPVGYFLPHPEWTCR